MADPKAAATNFLNALEKIPGSIAQRKEKNEALAKQIPQLQEIAGKVWKKEDELKQLKSELAALDRKIQLELAPPTPETAEKKNEGETMQHPHSDTTVQIRSPDTEQQPKGDFISDHIIIGRPGLRVSDEQRPKGIKM